MSSKTVRDIMQSTEICLKHNMTLDKVSDHLTKYAMPGAPVIDGNNKLVGYVSIHDCLKQLMQSIYYCDNTALAEDVMTPKVISASPDTTLIDMATEMTNKKLNALPVVENGNLVGVISRRGIMQALVKELEVCAIPAT